MSAEAESTYEIEVHGHLDPDWGEFLGLDLTLFGDRTLLTGPLDQAALHRVLRKLADLSLELQAVRRR